MGIAEARTRYRGCSGEWEVSVRGKCRGLARQISDMLGDGYGTVIVRFVTRVCVSA